jgi:hypothetical protein
MTIKLARPVQPRLWRNLALASATVTLAAMPALGQSKASPLDRAADMGATLWLADGSEGGEAAAAPAPAATEGGEQGESGSVASGDDTVDLLAGLLQIEGHLATGFALWADGDHDNGQAHMGHPKAEVYEAIEHEIEELGQPQFEGELDELVDAAANGKDQATLDGIRAEIQAAVAAARTAAVAKDPRDDFTALVLLIRKAGGEWAEGVVEGNIANLHEYQDAWGFVQAARARATDLAASPDAAVKAAADAVLAALDSLAPALPAVTPTGVVGGDAGLFAATAARIELAAYKVK